MSGPTGEHLLKLRHEIDLADILPVLAPESEAVRWCILDIGEVAPLLDPYREWSDHESVVDSPTGLELSLGELTAFAALGHQVIDGIFVGFTGSAPRRDDDDAAIIASAEILAAMIDSSFWLIGGPEAVLERVSAALGPRRADRAGSIRPLGLGPRLAAPTRWLLLWVFADSVGRPGYSEFMARVPGISALFLWLCAEAVILVAVGWDAWPVVAGWAAGGIVVAAVAVVAHRLDWARSARAALAGVLVAGCVVLTWEGGLFFVPATLALLVAALAPVRTAGSRVALTSTQ